MLTYPILLLMILPHLKNNQPATILSSWYRMGWAPPLSIALAAASLYISGV